MNILRKSTAIVLLASIGFLATSCFGRFELTRKLYSWNDSVTDNKFLKTLLFYGMSIVPVYLLGGALDVVIFNLVEFWSGTNPLAMNEGDVEERLYAHEGVAYKMVATKNQLAITPLDGDKAGITQVLRFETENKTWYYEDANTCLALMTFEGEDNNTLRVYTANGETLHYALNTDADMSDMASMFRPMVEMGGFAKR